MTKPTRPRMSDIARAANVNRITVSRALSRPELVASETLRRINDAIAKTGYIPNQIARGMKSEHSRIVSLVTPPQMSGVYGAILENLASELYKEGLIVNLFPVHGIEGQQEAILLEHDIGERSQWDADYNAFARAKARQAWLHATDTHRLHTLQPHRLRVGDIAVWGAVCLDGIVVGASGAHPWYDEAFSTMVAAALRALVKEAAGEQQQPYVGPAAPQ